MAGLNNDTPIPTELRLHQQSRLLEIHFDNGVDAQLSHELLRVYSPSAEVRGHGAGQEVLQTGKREVAIMAIEPVGNYGVKLVFSDGHDSGIYSWDHLYLLATQHESLWADYLRQIEVAGASRDIATPAKPPARGCGH
jgi:DUF971 family protein